MRRCCASSRSRPRLAFTREQFRKASLGRPEDRAVATAHAQRIPTLVKDTKGVLPLSPKTHRRVLIASGGLVLPFVPHPLPLAVPDMLEAEGFEVTL